MRRIVEITAGQITPTPADILGQLGMPADEAPGERTASLVLRALDLFQAEAAPAGILSEIPLEEFGTLYRGAGHNDPETPIERIVPRADRIALFVVTLGEAICAKISELFASRDFALASMLDAAASEGTERAGTVVEKLFLGPLNEREGAGKGPRSLRYSPGYCGWHVSGQRALFDALEPEEIGVALRESFLMQPLKSMSGVIVVGPGEIHDFDDDYPFCVDCQDHGCRERIRSVLE